MILHILCQVHPVTGQAHRQQAAVHLHIKAVQKMAAAIRKLQVHQVDRRLLLTLIEKFNGGPVGLDTLAAAIGEDSGTIEDVYEPYLIQNGFLNRTPRGRMATDLAYQHLGCERDVEA